MRQHKRIFLYFFQKRKIFVDFCQEQWFTIDKFINTSFLKGGMTMGDSATKIILEGGNNKDRIGGSSTIIVHTDEKGKVTKVMYDLGALFAPENLPVGSFVANVTKHLGLAADPELKKSVKNHDEIEKIRNFHKHFDRGLNISVFPV